MKNNSVVIDATNDLIPFPHMTIQVKSDDSKKREKHQPNLSGDNLKIPPLTTKTSNTFVDNPLSWRTTGLVTRLERFTETTSLLISY